MGIVIEVILTLCVVGIIVCLQAKTYGSTKRKIKVFSDIFSKSPESDYFLINDEATGFVRGIKSNHKNPILNSILESIGRYLSNNKGSVTDYHLIKDIVDRNCDSAEEEISTQVPMPLYFGLMGTMAGIIIGVLSLIICGDLSDLLSSTTTESGSDGITALLLGVGLAMIASIVGIILTTSGSSLSKEAKVSEEKFKNIFITWIQANLLPELSSDAAGALQRLATNLTDFNRTFSINNQELRASLATVNEATQGQAQLLERINRLNITRIATANVDVYDHLRNCSEEIGRFGQYVNGINNYIESTRQLIEKLDNAYERTRVIEEMAAFFRDERTNLDAMKTLISTTIGETDVKLTQAMNNLTESTTTRMTSLQTHLQERQVEFQRVVNQEQDALMEALTTHRNAALDAIRDNNKAYEDAIQSRSTELGQVTTELKNMATMKDLMSNMCDTAAEQSRKIDALSNAIRALASAKTGTDVGELSQLIGGKGETDKSGETPKWLYWVAASAGTLLCVTCIAVLIAVL